MPRFVRDAFVRRRFVGLTGILPPATKNSPESRPLAALRTLCVAIYGSNLILLKADSEAVLLIEALRASVNHRSYALRVPE